MTNDIYSEENKGLDISKLCDKHNIGRHDLIGIATTVARLGDFTPLQALEKFTAIKDDGDGSAFKVDGVRGSKSVGVAGDTVGSKQLEAMDDATALRVSGQGEDQSERDQRTVREALQFFFHQMVMYSANLFWKKLYPLLMLQVGKQAKNYLALLD